MNERRKHETKNNHHAERCAKQTNLCNPYMNTRRSAERCEIYQLVVAPDRPYEINRKFISSQIKWLAAAQNSRM